MDLHLVTRPAGDCVVVAVTGDVDNFTAPQLRAELEAAFDGDARGVVVDLSGTEFMDSSGLGALVGVSKQHAESGRRLALVCPRPHLRKLFRISRLDEVLPVFDTLDEALRDAS